MTTPTSSGWDGTINGMPKLGDYATRQLHTSAEMVESYARITGDRNPLHFNQSVAEQSRFAGLIVHGGIITGVLNALVAQDLPGPGSVFLSMELLFSKAVKIGETITGRVEVLNVRDDKPICTLAVEVRNSSGEICLSGKAITYTAPLTSS